MKARVIRPGLLDKKARTYGADFDQSARFKFNNQTNILPKVVEKYQPTGLIIQASITDISNIKKHLNEETHEQLYARAEKSSIATLQAASQLLSNHPHMDIMVFKRPPRQDDMAIISDYANQVLTKFYYTLDASIRDRITIGNHDLPTSGQMGEHIFGSPSTTQGYDGVHLRGQGDVRAITDSIINSIKNQNNIRRKTPSVTSTQQAELNVHTSNRFSVLN